MLVLSRKRNESILIDDNIKIVITDIGNGRVRVGIEAPKEMKILRGEIAEREDEKPIVFEASA